MGKHASPRNIHKLMFVKFCLYVVVFHVERALENAKF